MKYFKTIHEKNSARITALISIVLFVLLFVVGTKYMDPPEEYGVAVNFGTTNFGKGNVQVLQPVNSESRNIEELSASTQTKETVLTEDNIESIAIKKQKDAEAKVKSAAEAKAKAEAERIAKERQEQEEKKRKLDALIGGVSKSEGKQTDSEGDDNKQGDKGQLDGNPYAPSYFGGQGTGTNGVGYGLNGRGRASYKTIRQKCNESGLVIVRIVVNREGNVIEAIPGVKGSTNTAQCLLDPAKKIALSHKWPSDSKAPVKQIGFVKVNFNLGQ